MVEEDEAVIFLRQNTHLFSFQCYLHVCTVCSPMLREEFSVRTATLNLNDGGDQWRFQNNASTGAL